MIHKEGWLRKKGSRLNIWGDRYFVLRGQTLYYYLKPTDTESKGFFTLLSTCKVSEILSDDYRRKKQYVFRLSWPPPADVTAGGTSAIVHTSSQDAADSAVATDKPAVIAPASSDFLNSKARRRGSNKEGDVADSHSQGWFSSWWNKDKHGDKGRGGSDGSNATESQKAAGGSSGGAGGAGAGGGGAGGGNSVIDHDRHIILACDTYHEAQMWVHAIESQILDLQTRRPVLGRGSGGNGRSVDEANLALRAAAGVDEMINSGKGSTKRYAPPPGVRIQEVEAWARTARWEVHGVVDGVRLLRPATGTGTGIGAGTGTGSKSRNSARSGSSSQGFTTASSGKSVFENLSNSVDMANSQADKPEQLPCLRINVNVNCSAATMLRTILDFPSACWAGSIKSVRVIETLENYLDVIHIGLESMVLYPTTGIGIGTRIAPRDLCLMRYWRQNEDGSYIVCLDSTFHQDCPVQNGYVRADMHAAYIICSPKDAPAPDVADVLSQTDGAAAGGATGAGAYDECMVSFISQLDPRGWVWIKGGYRDRVLESLMLHVLDLKDSIDVNRFAPVIFDPDDYEFQGIKTETKSATKVTGEEEVEVEGGERERGNSVSSVTSTGERKWMGNTPASQCPPGMWGEPASENFKLRGKSYLTNKTKVASAPSLFKLIAIDLFDTGKPVKNICSHPRNRVYQALRRGEDTWVFVMNIMLPGPPFLSFCAYWQADKSLFQEDTPFGKIARPFFEGNDNEFRNNRFKLIPKVVSGNFIVKQAVKDTPTLLGNKLDQYYFKGDNYFELDVDVGSSSIAKYVTGIAMNYSKTLVCDMGLCLQGNDESELPEVLMGGCTCIHIDTTKAVKL